MSRINPELANLFSRNASREQAKQRARQSARAMSRKLVDAATGYSPKLEECTGLAAKCLNDLASYVLGTDTDHDTDHDTDNAVQVS